MNKRALHFSVIGGVLLGLLVVSGAIFLTSRGKPAARPVGIPSPLLETPRPFTFLPLEPFVTPQPTPPAVSPSPSPMPASSPPIDFITAAEEILKFLQPYISPSPPLSLPAISPRPIPEDEVFSRIWPQSYVDQLIKAQDALISQGILKTENKFSLQSTDGIISFLSFAVDYLHSQGVIATSAVDGLKQGLVTQFKQRKEIETQLIRQYGGYPLLPQPSPFSQPTISPQSFQPEFMTLGKAIWRILSRALGGILHSEQAQAFHPPGTPCFIVFKPGVPGCVGVTLWAPCCDCGSGGVTPIGLGCLNAVCPFGNAIYDWATGLCGCDQWFSFCGIPYFVP